MEMINRLVAAIEATDPVTTAALWDWTVMGTIAIAFTNFLTLQWQLLPIVGSKGIYPIAVKQKIMRRHFPVWRQLLHYPVSWFRFLGGFGDFAISLYPKVGMVLTGLMLFLQSTNEKSLGAQVVDAISNDDFTGPLFQVGLMWAIWFFHAITCDLGGLVFPWHNMMNESLLILALSLTTQLSPYHAGGALYTGIGVAAIRVLGFRVMFGFGKMKFAGCELKDWKYIKGFVVGMPVPHPWGLWIFRHSPDWLYAVAYLGFFVSECILVWAYFVPWCWWRVAACLMTIKLMAGIMATGNFVNFNILVAVGCLAIPLPVTGRAVETAQSLTGPWSGVAALAYWALIGHMAGGFLIFPFNSWVSGSWHSWSSFKQLPVVAEVITIFEVTFQWRMCQSYGIFPPNSSAIQRQIPLFEGSRDGKTWHAYRYNAQPTQATDAPRNLPGIQPCIEFMVFYQLGSGLMQSAVTAAGCLSNFESRPTEEIARNLLTGGDAADLFRIRPFPKSDPPKYVRCMQLQLLPETSGPNWWKVTRTQLEIPAMSLETVDILLPKVYSTDPLVDTEPGAWLWRSRTNGRQAEIQKIAPVKAPASKSKEDVQKYNDQRALAAIAHLTAATSKLSGESAAFVKEMKKCAALDECLAHRDRAQKYHADPVLRQEIHRLALLAADILTTCGWPWYGENKPRIAEFIKAGKFKTEDAPLPITIFQLYLFCLNLIANPKKTPLNMETLKTELLEQVEGPASWYKSGEPGAIDFDERQIHDGIRLLVGLFPRPMRQEASVHRRWATLASTKNMEHRAGDLLLPGYQLYRRALFQKTLPFFPAKDPKLADSVPNGEGGCWGEEVRGIFAWGNNYEYEFHGFSKGDHRKAAAKTIVQ